MQFLKCAKSEEEIYIVNVIEIHSQHRTQRAKTTAWPLTSGIRQE